MKNLNKLIDDKIYYIIFIMDNDDNDIKYISSFLDTIEYKYIKKK